MLFGPGENAEGLRNMAWLDLRLDDERAWDRWFREPGSVPARLAAAWRRALDRGAAADGSEARVLTAARLAERTEALGLHHASLDDAVGPAVSALEARDFELLFADVDGVVVRTWGGGGFAEQAQRAQLRAGAIWDEPTRGTNAIGTALAEDAPVIVHGHAHLERSNRDLVCYATPVRDPWGERVGVLDATSWVTSADRDVARWVGDAAARVERAWRHAAYRRGAGVSLRLMSRMLEPALLVSPTGLVTHANTAATVALRLPSSPCLSGLHRVERTVVDLLGVPLQALDADATVQGRRLQLETLHDGDRALGTLLLLGRAPASAPVRRATGTLAKLVGTDPALVRARDRAARVAPSTLPVLVLGETGTGKELLARGIHDASRRARGPFCALNCGGLAPSLLHAELFGYAAGAFTGAAPEGRDGVLDEADGGTLFLDELAEMPMPMQVALLRFLETGTFQRVGSRAQHRADVRVVAATHPDLVARVADGRFRADLFHRLRGVEIRLPSLRDRTDHGMLCQALLADLGAEAGRRAALDPAALVAVSAAPWPGNVRELRMSLLRGLVLGEGPWLTVADLELEPATSAPEPVAPVSRASAELEALRRALTTAGGNVSAAARTLGVARSTVYRMMQRHGLA
jgi:transcriptional regulator of acetoin/glycerol metabolism